MDYHLFCNKDTPKEERRKHNVGDIWINAAKCLICGETIRSKDRHDYVTCKCGNLSVDGGSWYIKRSFYYKNSTVYSLESMGTHYYYEFPLYIELSEPFNKE